MLSHWGLSIVILASDIVLQVGADCLVAEGVIIGERVSVKKSVIGRHCEIADKVKVTNSVIMDHVKIEEG